MVLTVGRRPARQCWLGLPIGTLLHLVFDGAWADTALFWWPLGGWAFDDAPLPEVARGWWTWPWSSPVRRSWRGSGGPSHLSDPAPHGVVPGRRVGCSRRTPASVSAVEHSAAVLILVRHGRTALNAAGRLQGRVDEPLDEVGQRRRSPSRRGSGRSTSWSPARSCRARQTAEAFGMPYTVDERWIELSYGVYEGVPHADVPSEAWRPWREDPTFVPEGGESLAALDARVREACSELAERAARRTRRRRLPRLADQGGRRLGARRRHRDRLALAPVARLDLPHRHPPHRTGAVHVQRDRR